MISTVLGPLPALELGVCLTHEHIWCDQQLCPRADLYGATRYFGSTGMRLREFNHMVDELVAYREAGGNALVELTCDGWGRDVDVLARLSEASGVHIVATAGFYVEPCLPPIVAEWTVERLADHITRELEIGVGDGRRRCGILKSAINRARVEGLELKVLKAVAIAHRRTGAAITTHTSAARRQEIAGGTIALQQLEVLLAEGVQPDRFIVGHADERPDIDVLCRLADQGSYIQFDLVGRDDMILDRTRAELIGELIRRGHLDRILLSQDRARESQMRYRGGRGYGYIFESFLPLLRSSGITEEDIRVMLVSNPARVLDF